MSNLLILLTLILALPTNAESLVSKDEQTEINNRLNNFYQNPTNAALMSQRVPKFGVFSGEQKQPNSLLKLKDESHATVLEKLAGVKSTERFKKHNCETFLKKRFPSMHCDAPESAWATVQGNDKVEDLADTWVDQVSFSLDEIPVTGKSDRPNWSDDYWRTRWGITSFRYSEYSEGHEFKTYKEAINSYAQPKDWTGALLLQPAELAAKIVKLSPSEKYDLVVGDEIFSLTNEQKGEGAKNLGADGNVEDWMGICHGWAPAAIMVDRPIKPVKVVGARGKEVELYPADVKALVSLAYANGSYQTNFVGGRCNDKKPKLLKNGRLADQDCFDTNPATFHLSLGNLIGRAKAGFVMDKTFDYEVWNQPVIAYEFTYFNPNDHSVRNKDWKKVVVPYDQTFKAGDRFQNPLTRGDAKRPNHPHRRGDEQIKQIVGVIATVVYGAEISPPEFGPSPQDDYLERVTYTYDLEFQEANGKLIPTGGEWHENAHPDFLWVPRKGTNIYSNFDDTNLSFTGKAAPSTLVTSVARNASRNAYPLCQVLKELVKGSSGRDTYECANK